MKRLFMVMAAMGYMVTCAFAGNVVSHKTGATATVGRAYAAKFQAYIDDLESRGARVMFMGGYRKGRCSPRHEHSCGKALDVCQRSRDVVDARCHLPGREELARIAESHGLFEGGQWCNGDMGHAQVDVTAPGCSRSFMARRRVHRVHYTKRHHRSYRRRVSFSQRSFVSR